MAMFVKLASTNPRGKHNCIERHTGTDLPKFENEEVIEIQADGDELDYILGNFCGLPTATLGFDPTKKLRVMRWFGDWAKFIYHNIHW